MKQLTFRVGADAASIESCGCPTHEVAPSESIALVENGWTRYSCLSEQEIIDSPAMCQLRTVYPAVAELCDRMQAVIDKSFA